MRTDLQKRPTLEVGMRLQRLLDRVERRNLTPEQLQALRGLEVLEKLGTQEAPKVFTALARQDISAWLQEEARGALARLARHTVQR
jgi:hypothetical protein